MYKCKKHPALVQYFVVETNNGWWVNVCGSDNTLAFYIRNRKSPKKALDKKQVIDDTAFSENKSAHTIVITTLYYMSVHSFTTLVIMLSKYLMPMFTIIRIQSNRKAPSLKRVLPDEILALITTGIHEMLPNAN